MQLASLAMWNLDEPDAFAADHPGHSGGRGQFGGYGRAVPRDGPGLVQPFPGPQIESYRLPKRGGRNSDHQLRR